MFIFEGYSLVFLCHFLLLYSKVTLTDCVAWILLVHYIVFTIQGGCVAGMCYSFSLLFHYLTSKLIAIPPLKNGNHQRCLERLPRVPTPYCTCSSHRRSLCILRETLPFLWHYWSINWFPFHPFHAGLAHPPLMLRRTTLKMEHTSIDIEESSIEIFTSILNKLEVECGMS